MSKAGETIQQLVTPAFISVNGPGSESGPRQDIKFPMDLVLVDGFMRYLSFHHQTPMVGSDSAFSWPEK